MDQLLVISQCPVTEQLALETIRRSRFKIGSDYEVTVGVSHLVPEGHIVVINESLIREGIVGPIPGLTLPL